MPPPETPEFEPGGTTPGDTAPGDTAPGDIEPGDIEPLDVDGVTAIATGTVAWAVLLVLGLLLRSRLEDAGAGWWIGVALAGFLLGLLGLPYLLGRRASLRRAAGPSA